MEFLAYIPIFTVLLFLNGFYVLAEFAAVKIRSSQIEEMIDQNVRGALLAQKIHANLDEYLSVCQVGITFASIALGFVGESMAVKIIAPMLHGFGGEVLQHVIATVFSVIAVSFIHILIGEQVPKLVAIRSADKMALLTALPLRWSHIVFYAPLWLLNTCSHLLLRLFRIPEMPKHEHVSKDELKIILDQSQSTGAMSFRRLLFMENIFDLAELKAKDAMKHVSGVSMLRPGMRWGEVQHFVREMRHSRYPLLISPDTVPTHFVHIKTIFAKERNDSEIADLPSIAFPLRRIEDSTPLEYVLSEMQYKRVHMMAVTRQGTLCGIITMEDILEEIVGTITDEYEIDPPVSLADVLTAERIFLHIEGLSIVDAVRRTFQSIPQSNLPAPNTAILKGISDRERIASSYLGKGIAFPHARMENLPTPYLYILRSEKGIPLKSSGEKVHIMFILLTPAGQPRIHQKIQARIAELMVSSDIVEDRLLAAQSPMELFEIVCTGEQATID